MKDPEKLLEKCMKNNIPVFVLCGTDEYAVKTLEMYHRLAHEGGCDKSFLNDLQQLMKMFERFVTSNPELIKKPD